MDILEELRGFFASRFDGAAIVRSLPADYPGYAIRWRDGSYGVAIDWQGDRQISEHFANAHLLSRETKVDKEDKCFLMLVSYKEVYRNEFASVCAQFLDPGKDGVDRELLLADPLKWWNNWKQLLGNASIDKLPYSVLCEMIVLKHVLSSDPGAQWTASNAGTHDIESDSYSYEVKSTKIRYGASVTISSQYQLINRKPLSLYFLRVEESPGGVSINDLENELVSMGYDIALLEEQLTKAGYEAGASARSRKYSVLEKRVYDVDDQFPRITNESFKGNTIPSAITGITYTVDLDGIKYQGW